MRVAIVGSRGYRHVERVRACIDGLDPADIVITGGATGVDKIATEHARARGLSTLTVRPDYAKLPPKLAPKARNRDVVNADHVFAFWDYREDRPGAESGGTANAIALAVLYGASVHITTDED